MVSNQIAPFELDIWVGVSIPLNILSIIYIRATSSIAFLIFLTILVIIVFPISIIEIYRVLFFYY